MKLASFRHQKGNGFGPVVSETAIDVAPQFPGLRLKDLLGEPHRIEAAASNGKAIPIEEIEWRVPVPDSPRIFCVGRNFKRAMEEQGLERPSHPILFARFASSLVANGRPIVRPFVSQQFDYEGELCVIIGKSGRHLTPDQALHHVAGYTCFNDGSVRDYQRHTTQDTPGKNFWHSGAIGPWIVTSDEIPDPSRLSIRTELNGETVQSDRLDDLLFSAADVLSYLSQIAPLEPGDLIALGTPLGSGVNRKPQHWLVPGDTVSVTIEHIGTLTNKVVDERDLVASG
jgi:2-keto-4-pentenoate hydratase/2-oxohepta-3-ene-1,7-dioic acid hydratase in catechol pathway